MADTQALPKFSLALGGPKKAASPAANPLKRPHASLFEDEDDEGHSKKVQAVTHFDRKAGGAIDESKPKERGPLVIKPQANRDWKEAGKARRQQSALPSHGDQAQQIAAIEAAEKRERDRSYGLNIMQPAAKATAVDEASEPEEPVPARERTADERAMDALLGVEHDSTLVVPAITEDDAFQHDAKSAPDGPTLDDYARVPVEEYGAAMLRGMGWNGGKTKTTKAPERRPAMLGVGAKSDAAISGELGGWGKSAKGKDAVIYNPVMLKDPKTGELFTDAELQKKQELDQRRKYEDEFEKQEKDKERRRRRNDDHDNRDRKERSERDRSDRHHSEQEPRSRHDRSPEGHRSEREARRRHDRSAERHRHEKEPRIRHDRSPERHRPRRHESKNQDERHHSARDRSKDRGDRHRSGRDQSRERDKGKTYRDDGDRRDRSKDRYRDRRDRR